MVALIASYVFLYRCNFPQRSGGQGSLIFFEEIGKKTEANYIREYESCGDEAYRRDLLGQIWRNSQILCQKYGNVSCALKITASALFPFLILLMTTSYAHLSLPTFKG
jgi:hypothetical protein